MQSVCGTKVQICTKATRPSMATYMCIMATAQDRIYYIAHTIARACSPVQEHGDSWRGHFLPRQILSGCDKGPDLAQKGN